MKSFANPPTDAFPFVKEAGVRYQRSGVDPLEAWIDLMEAVEALCPRWPQRPIFSGRDFRL